MENAWQNGNLINGLRINKIRTEREEELKGGIATYFRFVLDYP